MIEILGFRSKGYDITKIEKVLWKARSRIQKALTEIYHEMLSVEIADVVDDIEMRLVERPEVPVFRIAENMLNGRIRKAGNELKTEYNLEAAVSVLTDGEDTYYVLYAENERLIDAFRKTSGIEPYMVESSMSLVSEKELESEKTIKWNQLKEKYGKNLNLTSMKAVLTSPITVDTSMLKFPGIAERAELRARHSYTNFLLSQYASNEEVPPHRLMPLMDLAFAQLAAPASREILEARAVQLQGLLPEITMELIMRDPAAPMDGEQFTEDFVDTGTGMLPEGIEG